MLTSNSVLWTNRTQFSDCGIARALGVGSTYSDDELRWLMTRIPAKGDVYVMFNNLPRVGDAKRFISLIAAGIK